MKTRLSAFIVGLFTLGLLASQAAASTRFHNGFTNTIWTAHAFASTSGILCGWKDGCDGAGLDDWRRQGWWEIAPGGTVTVHGSGYGNAFHQAYAEDAFGHFWGGGGRTFVVRQAAMDFCGNDGVSTRSVTFFAASTIRCCGGACATNGTVHFNP